MCPECMCYMYVYECINICNTVCMSICVYICIYRYVTDEGVLHVCIICMYMNI